MIYVKRIHVFHKDLFRVGSKHIYNGVVYSMLKQVKHTWSHKWFMAL